MKTAIKTLAFGDKSAIARTLSTKGTELKASILESAILPILSNALAGHSTFAPVIASKGHNAACPLQAALWTLMHTKTGKPSTTATARAIGAVFALAGAKSVDQAAHDETLSDAIILIADALTPVRSEATTKAAKVDYESLYAGAQITIAEMTAKYEELTARYSTLKESTEVAEYRAIVAAQATV